MWALNGTNAGAGHDQSSDAFIQQIKKKSKTMTKVFGMDITNLPAREFPKTERTYTPYVSNEKSQYSTTAIDSDAKPVDQYPRLDRKSYKICPEINAKIQTYLRENENTSNLENLKILAAGNIDFPALEKKLSISQTIGWMLGNQFLFPTKNRSNHET
jgi:hypothetical protein